MALYCLRDLGGNSQELLAVAESCCEGPHTLLKLAALSLISRVTDSSDSKQRASNLACRLLETDPDAGVRRCAAVALGHIGFASDAAIEALRRAVANDADIFLKRSAEGALARLGAKS
jgi:HEAT repeat protein